MDIIPVPLVEPLEVNAITTIKLWICAPNQIGQLDISLHFAYNIPFEFEKKPLKRLLKRNFTIKILPSVTVTASSVNACLYDNNRWVESERAKARPDPDRITWLVHKMYEPKNVGKTSQNWKKKINKQENLLNFFKISIIFNQNLPVLDF